MAGGSFKAVVAAAVGVFVANPGAADGGGLAEDLIPEAIERGPSVALETVATGLTAPNWGTSAPGVPGRLFVADQDGILWAIDPATGGKAVFLDLSARLVPLGVYGGPFDERGFLGVAFDQDYRANGLLYTYTSEPRRPEPADFPLPFGFEPDHESVITEWRVPDPGDPAAAVDPESARVLVRIEQPRFMHNGGALNFGPDGMLYIALGDGGVTAEDLQRGMTESGQDTASVLGAILRIDPTSSNSANGQYGVPADNPFFPGGPGPFGGWAGCVADGVCDEIFAYGFRNPFRFSFDSATGELYAADAGEMSIEEVDVVVAGGNYGWRAMEGSFCLDRDEFGPVPVAAEGDAGCGPPDLIDPIAQYDHDEGTAVIGGFVYRGGAIPWLRGRYVFGDHLEPVRDTGRVFVLEVGEDGEAGAAGGSGSPIAELRFADREGLGGLRLLGFGQGGDGELYVLGNADGMAAGETGVVLRIVPPPTQDDGG